MKVGIRSKPLGAKIVRGMDMEVYDVDTGEEIHGVYKATWTASADDVARIVLEMYCSEVDIQGTCDVQELENEKATQNSL